MLRRRLWTELRQLRPYSHLAESHKKVIFSGIQPTGIPHLGNYLGALRQWVHLQNTADDDATLIYCLVDLHAITVHQNPKQLHQWKRESFATLLAIGLNPERSIIFHQSDVAAHSELMWILSCNASVGYLSRMTQWKSKLTLPENSKPIDTPLQLGLFSYPVLQAADILVHRATHVPVGEDQSQHLEFTRNCATGFNHLYGNVFPEPETVISPAKRIMSLTKPEKKMSKSDTNPKSRISIVDSKEEIERKIKAAVTDSEEGVSYDPTKRPELANLINMMHFLQEDTSVSPKDMISDLASKKALKDRLAGCVENHIAPIRERYHQLISRENRQYLDDIAHVGGQKANQNAAKTMKKVREVLGIGYPSPKPN